ncbi:MAG: hypothetical protein K0S38_476 [Candidatus Paceibacter sp.]|jgi:hypothetical protein|nr:hypothetical protein [Candidatus Paceibacter sp.]
MSRNKITLLIGILVVLMPFLGFPSAWKTLFYVLFGAILIFIAIVGHVRRRSPSGIEQDQIVTEVYVEKKTIIQ